MLNKLRYLTIVKASISSICRFTSGEKLMFYNKCPLSNGLNQIAILKLVTSRQPETVELICHMKM